MLNLLRLLSSAASEATPLQQERDCQIHQSFWVTELLKLHQLNLVFLHSLLNPVQHSFRKNRFIIVKRIPLLPYQKKRKNTKSMHALNTKKSLEVQTWQQYLQNGTLWQLQHQPLLSCRHQLMEKLWIKQGSQKRINLFHTDFELLISTINTANVHISNSVPYR